MVGGDDIPTIESRKAAPVTSPTYFSHLNDNDPVEACRESLDKIHLGSSVEIGTNKSTGSAQDKVPPRDTTIVTSINESILIDASRRSPPKKPNLWRLRYPMKDQK